MILGTLRAVLGAIYSRYRSTGSTPVTPRIVTANAWSCAVADASAWPQTTVTGSAWANTIVAANAEDGE